MEGENFQLRLGSHSGTAGDPISKFAKSTNGLFFSTPDRDNDQSKKGHCAKKYGSGWWFASCGVSNLNGVNYNSKEAPEARGIVFADDDHGFDYSFAEAAMMIRPAPAQ